VLSLTGSVVKPEAGRDRKVPGRWTKIEQVVSSTKWGRVMLGEVT